MSDAIIKVSGLGKKYIISHQGREPYVALRDVLSKKAKSLLNRKRSVVTKEEFWALKDINFEIQSGEAVGIIGRNGAGKSTLLKLLSRITEPSKGRIELKGRVASLLEVGTGFHPELTGRENIFLNGAILGMTRIEIRRKFDEIVDFAGVEKFLDTPVKRYSSGMYVRLAFSVAAHLDPEILIVDEVLSVGDSEFQRKCLGKMDDVSKRQGRTVLFVSHNMGTIMQLCNRCILLKKGGVELIGDPSVIVQEYYQDSKGESYKSSESDSDIYFREVYTCEKNGNPLSNFAHTQDINLRLTIGVNKYAEYQNIGICLLRQDKKRVFTVNKQLKEFYENGMAEIIVDFVIEGGLIAPMDYSFLVALNTKAGNITYDYLADVCQIKVYDNGTDFSFAEGIDYGCIILKDKWRVVK